MKVHKIEIIIVDFDGLGAEECCDVLENVNYPNDCISPNIISHETVDIGEWEDDNPLNNTDTFEAEVQRLFKK